MFADVEGIRDADVPGGSVGRCLDFDALVVSERAAAPKAWEYE